MKKNIPTKQCATKAEVILGWIAKLRERAADFRHKGERLRAGMLYAEILKLDPTLSDIQVEAAAVEKELTEISAHIESGEALFLRHEYGGAIAEWKEVLNLDKDNAEALFLIEKAKAALARANSLLEKARERRRLGQLDPAARTYEELLRFFPNLAQAGKELAEVNAEIRRANARRPRTHGNTGLPPGEEKGAEGSAKPSAKEIPLYLAPNAPRTWKIYFIVALLFLIFALLFKVLPLVFLAPSPSPLLAISVTLALFLLSLLVFSLYAFST